MYNLTILTQKGSCNEDDHSIDTYLWTKISMDECTKHISTINQQPDTFIINVIIN